ncbi:MAG: PDZ domain-containing protein [Phycisphaerales bacterium]
MNTNRTSFLLLACGGLLAAPALAQSVTAISSSSHGDDDKGTITMVISEDGKTTKATLKGGEIIEASVDGKTIDPKNIKKDDEFFYLNDDSGKELARVRRNVHAAGEGEHAWIEAPDSKHKVRLRAAGPGGEGLSGLARLGSTGAGEPPKVMIGVTMTEPDDVLAEHFGVEAEDATMIGFVTKDLPAEKAGLRRGDLIVAIDGKTPAGERAVRRALQKKNPGETVVFSAIQKGQKKDITVTLEAYDRKKLSLAGEGDSPFAGAFFRRMAPEDFERNMREGANAAEMEADMARELSARGREAAERGRELAQRYRERSEHGQGHGWAVAPLAPPAPAPPAPPGQLLVMPREGLQNRLEGLEERLDRLEELLERLNERLEGKGGGGNAKPPADEDAAMENVANDEDEADEADVAVDGPRQPVM